MMKRFCIVVTLYEVLAQQLYLYSQVDIPTFPFLIEKAIDRLNERDKRRVQWLLSKFPKSLFHSSRQVLQLNTCLKIKQREKKTTHTQKKPILRR